MAPKINGSSLADLVKLEVKKMVETQRDETHELLLGALARIKCLEKELDDFKVERSAPRLPSAPSSSSQLCRHWLKRRCTWNEKCRFSHGSDADSEGSSTAAITKDLEEIEMLPKDKQTPATSSRSSCEVTMNSSEIVNCLLNSKLPRSAQSHTGVNIVSSLLDEMLSSVVARAPPICKSPNKLASPVTGPCLPLSKEEEWVEDMLDNIERLDAKYAAKYSPQQDGAVIYSAEVAVPKVDFSKIKPHLHRNLPRPNLHPVYSCSPDPKFYTDCHLVRHLDNHQGCSGGCKPLFGMANVSPFGSLPGFETNLGIVSIPQAPIGGYIYKRGTGDETTWQLYAEAVYL